MLWSTPIEENRIWRFKFYILHLKAGNFPFTIQPFWQPHCCAQVKSHYRTPSLVLKSEKDTLIKWENVSTWICFKHNFHYKYMVWKDMLVKTSDIWCCKMASPSSHSFFYFISKARWLEYRITITQWFWSWFNFEVACLDLIEVWSELHERI